MGIQPFISEITRLTSHAPAYLLQNLCDIQQRFSCIPKAAIQLLSEKLGLSQAYICGVISFYRFLHETPRGDYDIRLSDNITDHMLGSRALLNQLSAALQLTPDAPRPDGRVTVSRTSCTGMCDQGPAMLVNGRVITHLDTQRIAHIAEFIRIRKPLEQWPQEYFRVHSNIRRRDLLLCDTSERGAALEALENRSAKALLQEIEASNLRGRGGAGFKTGLKWRLCGQTPAEQRYVVCNADEGEPGTFKDRVILSEQADRVIEGMTLCAGVIGARHGLIYLRAEYRYLRKSLEDTLSKRRRAGLLGKQIRQQPGFDFDIEIHMGAGAYICGEESALIESLEGKRGIPRNRPPFPVSHGYQNQPTVVNNVETFLAASFIATHGADRFKSRGTGESSGTKLLSISGDCRQPGIYEYPFGTPVQQILQDCGAHNTQAVQLSGAAGSTLSPPEFDRRIAFEDVATGGSFMVFNRQRDLLDMVQNFSHFFAHESCGFCTPCRVGSTLSKNLIDKIYAGHAGQLDIDELVKISDLMQSSSHCGLGTSAPNPILDTLKKFPDIYQKRLQNTAYQPAFDLDSALQEARNIRDRRNTDTAKGPSS